MTGRFRDQQHLIRMGLLFAAGILAFVVLRQLLVPADFGLYGHYRASALDDARAREPLYAGRQACGECHEEVVQARAGSAHQVVGCEACHGPLAVHAAEPSELEPTLPDSSTCLICHLANVARPAAFPQVEPEGHAAGEPAPHCHQPHHPEVS